MDLLDSPTPAPLVAPAGLRLVPLRAQRWRVIRADGSIMGYLERGDDAGLPFRSLRKLPREAQPVMIGTFARAEDALDALR